MVRVRHFIFIHNIKTQSCQASIFANLLLFIFRVLDFQLIGKLFEHLIEFLFHFPLIIIFF